MLTLFHFFFRTCVCTPTVNSSNTHSNNILFFSFFQVVYADVATDGDRSKGWGTVRFSTQLSRDLAIQRYNGANMGSRNIEVRVDRGRQ